MTLGAQGQGMVAGDLVNTASRVQSVAEPGSVFVGESTRRSTERAIVYEDAGAFELKGKDGETRLWKALRVVSGVGGTLKSEGLEAPFVGRDRELRQIKDLFHVCADEQRGTWCRCPGSPASASPGWPGSSTSTSTGSRSSSTGTAAAAWPTAKASPTGRWPTWCGCAAGSPRRTSRRWRSSKLHAALEEHILDAEERRFVEPRLAQLLGLGEHEARDRQDLFAAWRLFFERLADAYPTVLAFEDMQWADASLLDFVEYLLEWSRNHPIYVITLARPELAERRPTWGAGHRNFTSLYLEPLPAAAMEELLAGLVPGLPAGLRTQILARAEGVPLYAVETVRMLLDRGALVQEGPVYQPVGEIAARGARDAARADRGSPGRALGGGAAAPRRCFGARQTFTLGSLVTLTGLEHSQLEQLLGGFGAQRVLGLQSDPRSPEQGQYGFLQDLLRHVAYETLPRQDRKAKHLAAAEHLAANLAEDEVVEVIASHLLDAYRLDPDAADAEGLRARAHLALLRAGERAASLGASAEAQRYFEQAGELSGAPTEQAAALSRAGEMALNAGAAERAAPLFGAGVALFEAAGETHAAPHARVSWLALIDQATGRQEEAIERMERAYAVIADDEPDADMALLLVRLGAAHFFSGNTERAIERTELGLDIAESLQLAEALSRGLNSKAMIISPRRPEEGAASFPARSRGRARARAALAASVIYGNLSDVSFQRDRYGESLGYLEQSLALARRIGNRQREWFALSG